MNKTPLTEMVIEYQKTRNNLLMKEIIKHTTKIGNRFLASGKFRQLPDRVKSELLEGFNSIALTKSIQKFDEKKGNQFSTVFVWELRHYAYIATMASIRKKRTRPCIISLDTPVMLDKENKTISIADIVSNYNTQVNHKIDKFVQDVMLGNYVQCYPGQKLV